VSSREYSHRRLPLGAAIPWSAPHRRAYVHLGATAEAGCSKPGIHTGACAFRPEPWTCAHATRPPESGDRVVCWGFEAPLLGFHEEQGDIARFRPEDKSEVRLTGPLPARVFVIRGAGDAADGMSAVLFWTRAPRPPWPALYMARAQAKLAKLQVSSFFQRATITHSASAELFSYVELNVAAGLVWQDPCQWCDFDPERQICGAVRNSGFQACSDLSCPSFTYAQPGSGNDRDVGHRVIDLATRLDGTKSPWRFNAGGWTRRSSAGHDARGLLPGQPCQGDLARTVEATTSSWTQRHPLLFARPRSWRLGHNATQTLSDDLEDNHWHREKECPWENQLDNDPERQVERPHQEIAAVRCFGL